MEGYSDGSFKPSSPIPRLDAVISIVKALNVDLIKEDLPEISFTDYKKSDRGYEYVAYAVKENIISGKQDGTFDPQGTLTRGQMAKILTEAFDLKSTSKKSFKDVEKGNWLEPYVSVLASDNITTGYPDGTFGINKKLTRQHFAVFLARTIDDKFKPSTEQRDLVAHFLDVGQGDSILLQLPNGKTVLIDGGKRTAGEKVVAYLKKAGISTIDLLVATHPDADHIGGLVNVLEEIKVNKVLDSGKDHSTQTYLDYLTLIDTKNIAFEVAKEGQKISLDSSVTIQVLNSCESNEDNNESSIVLKVSYGTVDFLLTGDVETDQELQMLDKFDVSAEIYKAAHHGSNTGNSKHF